MALTRLNKLNDVIFRYKTTMGNLIRLTKKGERLQ